MIATAALGAAFAFAAAADAAPITFASLGIGGTFSLPPGSHLGNTDAVFIGNGGAIVTQADIGDLAGLIPFGSTGTLADIPSLSGFTPITGYLVLSSGVSLDLHSITVDGQSGAAPGFLNISGYGTLHAPGFDSTQATVTWTGTTTDNRSFTLALHTTAQADPDSVPEPLSLALLGLGLLGVFFTRRVALRTSVQAA